MDAGSARMVVILAAVAVLALATHSQQRSAHPTVFTSADGAFQFSYPASFEVCVTGKLEPCMNQAYIPPCEDDAIVCVVYPSKQSEDSSFGAAAFQVREIRTERETMTADVCVTPYPTETPAGISAWPAFQISAQHPAKMIRGVLFVHGISGQAAMSHWSTVDLYRAFHRQKCYELSVSESGTNPRVADPPLKTLTHAQQRDVDESLSQILNGFRFLK